MKVAPEIGGALVDLTASNPSRNPIEPHPSLALVMPMAGKGSRFRADPTIRVPKPLVTVAGRPLFWWATESVRRAISVRETVFVVLKDHVIDYAIDREIIRYYPEAIIVELDQTTSGAAETAALGVAALASLGPFAVNDCDHAFSCNGLMAAVARLADGADGALLTFRSSNPAFSYLRLSADGEVAGTIEKQVESAHAIGGCYIFANATLFLTALARYRAVCRYDELFISGLFNCLCEQNARLLQVESDQYCPLGTPADLDSARARGFQPFLAWI